MTPLPSRAPAQIPYQVQFVWVVVVSSRCQLKVPDRWRIVVVVCLNILGGGCSSASLPVGVALRNELVDDLGGQPRSRGVTHLPR
jgi:hypothetical protein